MRLSNIPDSEFKPSKIFGIQVKNHKCYFHVKNEKHVFGSKLYPVGKRAEIFTPGNVDASQELFPEIARLIESESSGWTPTIAGCYSHAEFLHDVFKKSGISTKYFTGWVFPSAGFPIHHAWVTAGELVFDLAVNITSLNYMRELEQAGKNPRDKQHLLAVKSIEDNWKPVDQHFTWGNPHMIYIGSESDPIAARRQYNNAIDHAGDIGRHPSYRHMKKGSRYDPSPYQKAMAEIGGKLHQ